MTSLSNIDQSKVSILCQEYKRRKICNDQYSKRAFARDLGVSHTLLSLVMSGKRSFSPTLSKKLITLTSLSKQESDILSIGLPLEIVESREKISLETFAMMSDWSHYAVLSLTETADFEWDEKWISQRLGLKIAKTKAVMKRLLKLGMIEKAENGKYQQGKHPIVVENTKATEATKKFNRGLMKKADNAMDEVPDSERDLSSIVFAMDPAFVSYATERIRQFRRSLCQELENLGTQEEVYSLTVQICPLSKKTEVSQ